MTKCKVKMTEMPPYLAVKDEEKNSGQAESDSSDGDDWDLPLTFNKPRHIEPIKGAERVEHSWRVKEKVRQGGGSPRAGGSNCVCRHGTARDTALRMTTNAHGPSTASAGPAPLSSTFLLQSLSYYLGVTIVFHSCLLHPI